MDIEIFKQLMARYKQGTLTQEEWETLRKSVANPEFREALYEDMGTSFETPAFHQADWSTERAQQVLQHIQNKIAASAPVIPVYRQRRWWLVAAALVVILGGSVYFASSFFSDKKTRVVITKNSEIQPGQNGALLTLADGRQVLLDTMQNGEIILQGGGKAKLVNGILKYEGGSIGTSYNTTTTPKGRQFQVTLPDGTEVWLNSASSITYPTAFTGNKRKVTITGEVYFEVNHINGKQKGATAIPFVVQYGNMEVEVLGTRFNINAYKNEPVINTTLLEGSVRVQSGSEHVIIKPGQQAQLTVIGGQTVSKIGIQSVNTDAVMAWKNGLFYFEGVTLAGLMRQLERWYDIEVIYQTGAEQTTEFAGKMTRGVTLNQLLESLEELGVHCRLEGRKLIVEKTDK